MGLLLNWPAVVRPDGPLCTQHPAGILERRQLAAGAQLHGAQPPRVRHGLYQTGTVAAAWGRCFFE